jgi:hypothetical protein
VSAIPPNWLGSSIQGLNAQARAAEKQSREAADQARQTDRASFSDTLLNTVENSDSNVDEDAEGRGGGPARSRSGPDQPDENETEAGESQDTGGVDVQA